MYLGQHWPSDVVGGLVLGAAVAWATLAASRARQRHGATSPAAAARPG
ncbi:MAG: phosphatase PAP2 family protein [Chloroflexota bacterium]|nr:phosphatase PAP2 family protein [Chloroflexota bacterium]